MTIDFILVMGVSGAGKSLIARALADRISADFIEADAFHSASNVERMRQGIGLTDTERWPWLDAVADAALAAHKRPVVIACSALRRAYRDFLRHRLGRVFVVFLEGDKSLLTQRLQSRTDHFAGPSLLESQLATLEPPAPDESAITLPIAWTQEEIVTAAVEAVRTQQISPAP